MSAATDEQTSSLVETTETIQELSTLADDLNDQVTGFETQQETAVQANTQSQVATDGGNMSAESPSEEGSS